VRRNPNPQTTENEAARERLAVLEVLLFTAIGGSGGAADVVVVVFGTTAIFIVKMYPEL
jgi:hypothetical protein